MANNRMFIVCLHCLYDDNTSLEEARVYIAKYYPTGGWGLVNMEGLEGPHHIDSFFEKHLHKTTWEQAMFGDHFTIITESMLKGADPMVKDKREILSIVERAVQEGKVGH